MRIEFLGGVRTVTGSAILIEKGSQKILVDCGMFQGGKVLEERNWDIRSYHPKDVSIILLTHAHIDHSGLIPKMVREGYQGQIICTKATVDLCEILLRDSAHIQEMEAEWENRKGKRAGREEISPLYSLRDAERSLQYFSPVSYGEMVSLGDGIEACFQDAGHILGSAIIELWMEEGGEKKKLVFSGDLGNLDQPFLKDPSWIREGDILKVNVEDAERWKRQGFVEWVGSPFISEVKAPDTFKVVYVEGVRVPSAPLAAEVRVIEGKRGVPTSFAEAPVLEETKPMAVEGVYAVPGPLARRLEEKPDWFKGDVLEAERIRLEREWRDTVLVAKLKILAERFKIAIISSNS